MPPAQSSSWRRRLGLERGAGALAAGLFVYGFGEELWFRYLPALLRFLGASAFTVGAFGTLKDLLDAAYSYPGGVLTDRLGSRRALLLFGALTTAGFFLYLAFPSIPLLFAGLFLVMAWQSLGLPATFTLLREEAAAWQEGNRRLYDHLRQAAPDLPGTLEALQPLYAAVVHGAVHGERGAVHGERSAVHGE